MPEDDLQVLCESNRSSRSRAIAAGTVKFFKTWPDGGGNSVEFLAAILAVCLICAAFAVLAIVPVMLALRHRGDGTCRLFRTSFGRENDRSTNVYFLKHENRTWTNNELCYIETAARRYPDYNIFLINLLEKDDLLYENELSENTLEDLISLDKKNTIVLQDTNSSETKLRYEFSEIPNIQNIDISVDKFFARSMVANIIQNQNVSNDDIELAAKFQLIWDYPGIALEPLDTHELETIRHFFNKTKDDVFATLVIDADLQATSVACQSFIGHVLREMAKNKFEDRQTLLNRTLSDFCSSFTDCDGVRIINPIATRSPNFMTCPTTDSASNASIRVNVVERSL